MKRFINWLLSGTIRPNEYEHIAKIYLNLI